MSDRSCEAPRSDSAPLEAHEAADISGAGQRPEAAAGGPAPGAGGRPGSAGQEQEAAASWPGAARPRGMVYFKMFLISFTILFLELACIRWFGSTVVFLTFFTNIILLACFLGTSIGCLVAGRGPCFLKGVLPTMVVAVLISGVILHAYDHPNREGTPGLLKVDVGHQESPQQIFFGAEYQLRDPSQWVVPIEVLSAIFYILVALIFVGLGQVMGRLFSEIPDRVAAYGVNIAGSLAGIAAFAALSYLRTPPYAWFLAATLLVFFFLDRWSATQVLCQAAVLLIIADMAQSDSRRYFTHWSPYYKVHHEPQTAEILTNNIGHQSMRRIGEDGSAYVVPHLLNRDAGREPFQDVLIIGAGSGNDVQAALSHGARHIDAVELDPVIYEIGRAEHPNRPYSDPRVSVHLDDGRSFVRKTEKRYDLIVYALVDSLVLHSGYSSLRLESFLFTEEAFRDIAARLKPGGVFVMYNYYRQGWVVGRLATMAEEAFRGRPMVLSMPYREAIGPEDSGGFTIILAGGPDSHPLDAIRGSFPAGSAFWVHRAPRNNESVNGFGERPPSAPGEGWENWEKIAPAAVSATANDRIPTDDWPFLYLRDATIPDLNLRGMALIAFWSVMLLFAIVPGRGLRLNGRMFFLGAGFMLLETKSVVHMALLFGSTWAVNSIIFATILIMIFLSNLFVLIARPGRLWPFYALLFATLLINAAVPMSSFLALPGAAKVIASCAMTLLPIFFAGVIFSSAFGRSRSPEIDLGSNIGGIILGGLSENLSLVVGFNSLLGIALLFYVLSAALGRRAS
jgi:SAM-dependent methyltransferase